MSKLAKVSVYLKPVERQIENNTIKYFIKKFSEGYTDDDALSLPSLDTHQINPRAKLAVAAIQSEQFLVRCT